MHSNSTQVYLFSVAIGPKADAIANAAPPFALQHLGLQLHAGLRWDAHRDGLGIDTGLFELDAQQGDTLGHRVERG